MKTIQSIAGIVLMLLVTVAFGQGPGTGPGTGPGMMEPDARHPRGPMMDHHNAREMSETMGQMHQHMQSMSRMMAREEMMDPEHLDAMGEMMMHLGSTMQEMARQLGRGPMTDEEREQLRGHMEAMDRTMQQLERRIEQPRRR